MIRVFVVDDHPVVCEGVRAVLARQPDLEVVGCSPNAQRALATLMTLPVDVLLVDYSLPGGPGLSLCSTIARSGRRIACLVLSSTAAPQKVQECLQAGARGFLLKDVSPQQLCDAVRRVASGEVFLDTRVTEIILRRSTSLPAETYTDSELRVLRYIGDGLSNAEIAARMHMSTGTVKNRVASLLGKLGVRRRAEAVAAGARLGLLGPVGDIDGPRR